MRFLFILFLSVAFQTVTSQNQFVPVDVPYKTALENAKKEGKNLSLMYSYCACCNHIS